MKSDFVDEFTDENEALKRPRGEIETFATKLAEYRKEIEKVENYAEKSYKPTVDLYADGMASPSEVRGGMKKAARLLENLNELRSELFEHRPDRERVETTEEFKVENGFELMHPHMRSYGQESASEAVIAHLSYGEMVPEKIETDTMPGKDLQDRYEKLRERHEELGDDISMYRGEFLNETLDTTVSSIQLSMMDSEEVAKIEQEFENAVREERMKNPSDRYLGYTESDNGTESFEEARQSVRENTPRDKLPNEGLSKEEIEENSRSIEEALERIEERDDRGVY